MLVDLDKKRQKSFYKDPARIIGYLAFSFCVLLTQVFLILKKKQFEKVQAAELNF